MVPNSHPSYPIAYQLPGDYNFLTGIFAHSISNAYQQIELANVKKFQTLSGLTGLSQPVWATIGFFDGLHRGHQALLACLSAQARSADAVSLVITFSNLPRAFHHRDSQSKYLSLPDEKMLLLETQRLDAVLMLEYGPELASQSAAQFIQGLADHCKLSGLCVGYDSKLGQEQLCSAEAYQGLADAAGIDLAFADVYRLGGKAVKSSQVRKLIEAGDLEAANNLLGHPYFVLGEVVHGKGVGDKLLSTPTANIIMPPTKLSPPVGIYACTCTIGHTTYPAATAVMNNLQAQTTILEQPLPTLSPLAAPAAIIVETHLEGFSGNLYGKQIKLDFHSRLRAWIDFDTHTALQQQIQADIELTRKVCSEYLN